MSKELRVFVNHEHRNIPYKNPEQLPNTWVLLACLQQGYAKIMDSSERRTHLEPFLHGNHGPLPNARRPKTPP